MSGLAPRLVAPAVALLLALPALAAAQETVGDGAGFPGQDREAAASILSDRPGLGDGAHVLAPGVWQVEMGGQLMASTPRRYSFGQGLIRGGFSPLELRIYANSFVVDGGDGSDLGVEDLGVGAKVPLSEGRWRWSVLGLMTVPTGTDDFSARRVTGGGTLIGETSLTNAIGLALNAGYVAPLNGLGDGTFSVILTPGVSISAIPGLSAYAGVASYLGEGPDQNFLEAGVAYLSNADVQLDLNWGIETDSRDWFLGVGFARRWR